MDNLRVLGKFNGQPKGIGLDGTFQKLFTRKKKKKGN